MVTPEPPAGGSSRLLPRIEMRFGSNPVLIRPARLAIELMAERCGFESTAIADIGLCVNEAVANIIRHAYGNQPDRPIVLTAAFDRAAPAPELRITLRDWGNGLDPTTLTSIPSEPLRPGGVGMLCLRSLLHDLRFEKQFDGMLLMMVRRQALLPDLMMPDHDAPAQGVQGSSADDSGLPINHEVA